MESDRKKCVPGFCARVIMLMAASSVLTGCRTNHYADFPRIINEPAPLAESIRRDFGVVGVLPVAMATNVHWNRPKDRVETFGIVGGKTWNYLMDSAEWKGTLDEDDLKEDAATLGFITLISLTTGTAGALAAGISEERFRRSDASLREALAKEPFDRGMQKQLANLLGRKPATNVQLLLEAALTQLRLQGDKVDFSKLAAQGIDSIMDIRVSELCFEARDGINPELAFAPEVTISLIRISDGTVLHSSCLKYRGKKRSFTAWAENGAKPFRTEMVRAERQLARTILEQYFAGGTAQP